MRGLILTFFLLFSSAAYAKCPAVTSDCPSPTFNNLTVGGSFNPTSMSLSGTLGVSGATTLSSTLGVSGATTLSGAVNANGSMSISSGSASLGGSASNGGILSGSGATNDVAIQNKNGSNALLVLTGTTTVRFPNANSNGAAMTINGGGNSGMPQGSAGIFQIANTANFSGAVGSNKTAYLSSILFSGDTMDASAATGTDVTAMQISLVSGGSGMKGGRIALGTTFRLTASSDSSSSRFYQAFAPNIRIEANDGGSSGDTRASAFAMNPIATIGGGATFTDGPIPAEFDVSVEATSVTASMSGTVMTVTAVGSGTVAVGQVYSGSGVTPSTVSSLGTGTGGTGTYNMSVNQTVGSETMTGTNAPKYKKGISIVELSTDSVQASSDDVAMEVVNQSGFTSGGWKIGLSFGGHVGTWPISSTGTLIGTTATSLGGASYAAASGVDFSAVTFTTAAFKSTGFSVDGSGNLVANVLKTGSASLTTTAGAVGLSKMTASGSAPGAGGGKLELVCGTGAGTAKLVAYAGTSGTAATVLDNIGSGVTGC